MGQLLTILLHSMLFVIIVLTNWRILYNLIASILWFILSNAYICVDVSNFIENKKIFFSTNLHAFHYVGELCDTKNVYELMQNIASKY